ncbi:Arc family DNA-binding protein [Curvibacter microcysteis]|uniref:Arc family DNA-binding protein n=1 Tax=Curvibacter microcysteis TaxID=3026419 RepID=UPI003905A406
MPPTWKQCTFESNLHDGGKLKTQADFVKTALRIPPDLHRQVHEAADGADRTFNAEILHRLRESFKSKRSQQLSNPQKGNQQ